MAVADQAFSSLTNFALALVVARTVDVREFGAFSIVFAAYTIVVGLTRAVATEPLAVLYTGARGPAFRSATSAAAGAALIVAVGAALVCAAASLAAEGPLAEGLIALALILPGLILQDCWRLSFFAAERGGDALTNDALWACALVVGLAFLLPQPGAPSIGQLLMVWGGAAALAAAAGAAREKAVPLLWRAREWLHETRSLSSRYVPEFVISVVGAQLTLVGVGIATGLAEAGALRGGQVVLGPLNVLFMGAALIAVPEAVRALRTSRDRLTTFAKGLSGGLAGAALLWGAVVVALPDDLGSALLGGTWRRAEPTVLPLALWSATLGAMAGPITALRALGRATESLRVRAVVVAASLAACVVGALGGRAEGAAWGLATAGLVGCVLWWYALGRATPAAPPQETAVIPPEHAGDFFP